MLFSAPHQRYLLCARIVEWRSVAFVLRPFFFMIALADSICLCVRVCVWGGWPAPPSVISRSFHCLCSRSPLLGVGAVPWLCCRWVCLALPSSASWRMWEGRRVGCGPLLSDTLGSTAEEKQKEEDFYLQCVRSGHWPVNSDIQV